MHRSVAIAAVIVGGGLMCMVADHDTVTTAMPEPPAPADALAEQASGELKLMPPTFITLLELERLGSLEAIRDTIKALDLSTPRAVILIVMGIGVAVESLTGYGVSMLITIPLLLTLVSRSRAFVLALLGMSLMTWGALSIAALLGAELAGIPPEELSRALVTTSGPVAALLPLVQTTDDRELHQMVIEPIVRLAHENDPECAVEAAFAAAPGSALADARHHHGARTRRRCDRGASAQGCRKYL